MPVVNGYYLDNAALACCPDGSGGGNRLATPTVIFTGITASGFTVDWDDVPNADSYDVDIATDTGFTNIVDGGTGLTATEFTTTGRTPGTAYYARVIARDSTATYVDSDYGFNGTTTSAGLAAPTLQAQRSGTTARIYFNIPPGAENILLQRSTDPAFGGSPVQGSVSAPQTEANYSGLPTGVTYYVRAKSTASGQTDSPWSNTIQFTTFNTRLRVNTSSTAPSPAGLGVTFTSGTGVNANEELHFNSIASGSQTGNSSDMDIVVTGVTPSPAALATIDNAYLATGVNEFAYQDKNGLMHYGPLGNNAKFINGTYTFS